MQNDEHFDNAAESLTSGLEKPEEKKKLLYLLVIFVLCAAGVYLGLEALGIGISIVYFLVMVVKGSVGGG